MQSTQDCQIVQNYAHILSKSLTTILSKETTKLDRKPCALMVIFRDHAYIDAFKKVMTPIIHETSQYDNILVSFMENKDKAQQVANTVNSVLWNYNDSLIAKAFEPDWLHTYLEQKDFGVKYVMANHLAYSEESLNNVLLDRVKDRESDNLYESKKSLAHAKALNYSTDQLIIDLSQFIESNWTGFDSAITAGQLITDIIHDLNEKTRGMCHLSKHASQEYLFAIKDKAEYLAAQENPNINKTAGFQKYCAQIEKQYRVRVEDVNRHDQWKSLQTDIYQSLLNKAPNLKITWPSNDDSDEALQETATVPFKGLDLSYNWELDLNLRLSQGTISYQYEEQGRLLLEQLAGAIAAYYLGLMELKHDVKYEEMLIEHTKVMDVQPFFDYWLRLAEDSRPNI